VDQVLAYPQAKACSPNALGCEKGLKDTPERLAVHARARVSNSDAHTFAAILKPGCLPAT
jgi:hypothetical protein